MAKEPSFPSVRFLKLKAKALQKGYPANDPWAVRLFKKHWRGALPQPGSSVSLSDCYRLLATSFRCGDWSRLKGALELMQEIRNRKKEALSDADLDQLVYLLGARWPIMFWANRFIEDAGARGHQAVMRGLKHRTANVRMACSSYLDHAISSWDPATYQALSEAMTDENSRVRASVLHAMGCQRCKVDTLQEEAVELFLKGMQDKSPRVRWTALTGIGQFRGDHRVKQTYVKALDDENGRVRWTAAWGLQHFLDDPAVPKVLLQLLDRETNHRVIRNAVGTLTQLARRLKNRHRSQVEQWLGLPLKTVCTARQPDLHFYPIERLIPRPKISHAREYWIRVIYDEESKASSAKMVDEVKPLKESESVEI